MRRYRNPSVRGVLDSVLSGLAVGGGALVGYGVVKTLDGLWTFPFLQTTNIPGTTATVGDTIQSVLHATAITLLVPSVRSGGEGPVGRGIRQASIGAIAGAWLSVIHDLVASITGLPAGIQNALSGYPRMGAIAPGATYMPSLTAGPVFNPNARMMGYPAVMAGRGF